MSDPTLLDAMVEAGARAMFEKMFENAATAGDWENVKGVARRLFLRRSEISLHAQLRAAEAWPVPHKLLGREATEAMLNASGCDFATEAQYDWGRMFDAAPGVGDE